MTAIQAPSLDDRRVLSNAAKPSKEQSLNYVLSFAAIGLIISIVSVVLSGIELLE